jgi:4-amino-4-deoxy-L-arabinose transferase-like glycosyltransferase
LALIAIALAAWGQLLLAQDHLLDGVIVYVVAGGIFALALRRRSYQPAWEGIWAPGIGAVGRKALWQCGLGLGCLALAGLLTLLALRLFDDGVGLPAAWQLHLGGIALFLVAVYLLSPSRYEPFRLPPLRRHHLVFLVILSLAVFVRLYQLDEIPYGLWYDEADNGLQVRRMIQDPTWRPVYVSSTNLPAHFLYLVLLSFRLFGDTPFALRIVAVVLGVLTVPAAYLAGRELFARDRRPALVLAFFLAVSRWDVNWSRIGMHGVSVPLFELLTLWLLLRALRTGRLITFAWAGLSLGLGLSFYTPFRLYPVALVPFLAVWFLRRLSVRQFWPRLRAVLAPGLVFGVAAMLTAAPVIQFAVQQPEVFWARAQKMSILRDPNVDDLPAALAENVAAHALMFNYQGDPNGRHNLPGEPMLDPAVGVLFVLGLSVSLSQVMKSRYLLLLLWLGLMLSGGILSVTFEAPQSLRAIGTLPAAYALAVVPLELLLAEAEALFRRARARRIILWSLVLLLAFVGAANFTTYFYRQARDFAVWNAFATAETHLARQIRRLRADYDLYFDPLLFRHLTTRFLLPDFKAYVSYDPATVFPAPDPAPGKKGVVLFIAPDSRATRALLTHYYPDAALEAFSHPHSDRTVLFTYILDRKTVAEPHGLEGRYYGAGEAAPRFRRLDSAVDFDWAAEEPPVALPMRVDWQGALDAPASGVYRFAVDAPGSAELWLDQAPLPLDDDGHSPAVNLPAGVHALRLLVEIERAGAVRLLWRTPGQKSLLPVPPASLYHGPFRGHGLVGRFFGNDAWQGRPAFSRIDPQVAYYFHHIPMRRPYTVEWVGRLEIPEDGLWSLGTEAISATWLAFEGQEVLVNTTPGRYQQVMLELAPGWYDLRLRFLDAADHSHVYLYWQSATGERELIPPRYLYPPADGSWTERPGE